MTESWRQTMELGLVHFMAYPVIKDDNPDLTLSTLEEIACDEFFDVVEVRRSEHHGVHDKIRAIADQSGMKIGVGAQPGLLLGKLSLNSSDEDHRKAAIDEVKKAIDASYDMGARICAALSGPQPDDESQIEHEMDLMVDSCVQLCKYAQEKATDYVCWLSIEQFDHSVDKKCLIGPSERTGELAQRVKQQVDNFGLTVDLSHLPILYEDMTDWIATLAPHIIHLHAGNAVAEEGLEGYGDLHPRFGYPGGENDVLQLQSYIEQLIFAGVFQNDVPTGKMVFTFEVKPMPGESAELILAHTKRTFLRAWANI